MGLNPSERLAVVAVLGDQLPVPGSHDTYAQILLCTQHETQHYRYELCVFFIAVP